MVSVRSCLAADRVSGARPFAPFSFFRSIALLSIDPSSSVIDPLVDSVSIVA